jgi:lysozyme family protein
MAEFIKAFRRMIDHEGGYVNDPDDITGGETYKGVSRKNWPKWEGWNRIDQLKQQPDFPANLDKDNEIHEMIGTFYIDNFWYKMRGDDILNQEIANSIFDCSVNMGLNHAISAAQSIIKVKIDGIIGSNTINALNACNVELFIVKYALAKISTYVSIVKKRPTSKKYFYGWVLRALGEN